jgi:hypothetical protein
MTMPFTLRLYSATPLTKPNLNENELGDRKSGEPEDVPPTDQMEILFMDTDISVRQAWPEPATRLREQRRAY